jgi:hypothetical protein
MSEIIVNMSGLGSYTISLDLFDPAPDGEVVDVWTAKFCDMANKDCEMIYFEMDNDAEVWDIINEAIQTYRKEITEI